MCCTLPLYFVLGAIYKKMLFNWYFSLQPQRTWPHEINTRNAFIQYSKITQIVCHYNKFLGVSGDQNGGGLVTSQLTPHNDSFIHYTRLTRLPVGGDSGCGDILAVTVVILLLVLLFLGNGSWVELQAYVIISKAKIWINVLFYEQIWSVYVVIFYRLN